jgi:hypothetical protein
MSTRFRWTTIIRAIELLVERSNQAPELPELR